MRSKYLFVLALMIVLSPLLSADRQTRAAGIVGTGTADSCNDAALDSALAGGGTINFFCGTAPVTITIATEKMVAANATLDGGGLVTISGKNSNRIFHVATGVTLELNKITIAYGAANDPADGSNRNGSGGGILNEGGTVVLTDSTVTRSRADHNGGGIYNRGGSLKLVRTTVSGNTVGDNGGGIINEQGTVDIDNSTISGNYAGDNGGGVFTFGGKVNLVHATVFDNNAGLTGSGLLNFQNGVISMSNTIVANQPAAGSPTTGNCSGAVQDGGKNIQFPDNSCGASIIVADPILGTLADNGGFSQTHALLDGSPAIDQADDAACKSDPINAIDERTVVRPIGAVCDIGAYEYDPKKPGKGNGNTTTLVSQVCPTPTIAVTPGRTLIPCPQGTVYNRQSGKCEKPGCPAGTVLNRQTQKCDKVPTTPVCGPGQVFNTDINACSQCPAGQSYYSANGGCHATCPSGQLPNNQGQCVYPNCPQGQYRNDQGQCVQGKP